MKKRIISAAIMLLICIPLVLIGGLPFKIGIGLLAILAYKEIIDLKGLDKYPKGVVVIGLLTMLVLVYSNRDILFETIGLNYKYLMFSFLALYLPVVFYYSSGKYKSSDAFRLAGFVIFLGLIFNIVMNTLIYNKAYFWLLIIVSVSTDVFAYLTGMAIGKHKVTKISPKKSLEGFIGGALMGTAISSIYYMTFIGAAPLSRIIPITLILCLACELGDLFYSAIKREHDIKDFSNLIPGHGGILDRIDSLTFVVIAYVLVSGLI